MTERYYFSSSDLTAEEKKNALAFASKHLDKGKTIHIFIVAKKQASELLQDVFDTALVNKLKNGEDIKVGDFTYTLEAKTTFKNYTPYEVMVAFHIGDTLLEQLESGEIKHLVVCNFEQDRPHEWMRLAPTYPNFSAPALNK